MIAKKRSCGHCTACCVTHPISVLEYEKPKGQLCKFCVNGYGCLVYGSKIQNPCYRFSCEWLRGKGDEISRPDRSGVIFDLRDFIIWPEHKILVIWEVVQGVFGSDLVKQNIKTSLDDGVNVMFIYRSGLEFILFPPQTDVPEEVKRYLKNQNVHIISNPPHSN